MKVQISHGILLEWLLDSRRVSILDTRATLLIYAV